MLGTSVSPTKARSLDVIVQTRTKEFLCKPAEEQNPRLTTGSSAACKRFISGTKTFFPRHALHEKGSQRQKKRRSTGQQPGTKSASRPADKPRINRWSTAGQPRALFFHRFTSDFACSCFWETFKRRVSDALGGTRQACPRGEQFCWHPVLPDPAPPTRRAPRPDPPVLCPGFGLDRSFLESRLVHRRLFVSANLFHPKDVREHALHENGLQRQIGVDSLVSSQERRALAVPVTNRLSTAGQSLISFLHRFT